LSVSQVNILSKLQGGVKEFKTWFSIIPVGASYINCGVIYAVDGSTD